MAVSREFTTFLEEQLQDLGPVRTRRMFGGAGLFLHDLMFALVADDRLYMKVDDENRPRFVGAGLEPFRYQKKSGEVAVMSYYEAPESALDDQDELLDWAREGFDAALRAARAKPGKKKTRPSSGP